jgi:hypothetical protein
MNSVIEQLLTMEAQLKTWIGDDNCAAFRDAARNDTEHIPAYAQGASSSGVVAGLLVSIETAAQTLRKYLNVTLTTASKVTLSPIVLDPPLEQ